MELRYPIILILLLILFVYIFIRTKKEKKSFDIGSKIANTNYIKKTKYYQNKIKKYKLLRAIIELSCITSILASIILLSRPVNIEEYNPNEYNRDIFLCLDVSSSVDELNLKLVNKLKTIVNSLKGERFGITIFNTSAVTLVPLTDDYDYVIDVLDTIGRSIELNNDHDITSDTESDYYYLKNYIVSGTDYQAESKGSSLIGDGLASCIYNFSDEDIDRTRLIIFSTDNDLAGKPLISLSKSADISVSKNIKVYAVVPTNIKSNDKLELKNAVLKTGGKFYEENKTTVENIVNDIEKTSKSFLKSNVKKEKNDIPQIPFLLLLFSVSTLLILNKKVIV